MGRRDTAKNPAPSPGAAARTPGGRRSMTGPGRARAVTGAAGPTSARWPHARTSPLFPIAYLAAPRLTLAAQDCGGYTGYFRGGVLPEW